MPAAATIHLEAQNFYFREEKINNRSRESEEVGFIITIIIIVIFIK